MKTKQWFRITQNGTAKTRWGKDDIFVDDVGRVESSRWMRVEIWRSKHTHPSTYTLESWDGCEPIDAWSAWKLRSRAHDYTAWHKRMCAIGDALQSAGLRPMEANALSIRLMPETGLSRSDLLAKIAGAIGDDWTQIGVSRFGIRIRWPRRSGYWK